MLTYYHQQGVRFRHSPLDMRVRSIGHSSVRSLLSLMRSTLIELGVYLTSLRHRQAQSLARWYYNLSPANWLARRLSSAGYMSRIYGLRLAYLTKCAPSKQPRSRTLSQADHSGGSHKRAELHLYRQKQTGLLEAKPESQHASPKSRLDAYLSKLAFNKLAQPYYIPLASMWQACKWITKPT